MKKESGKCENCSKHAKYLYIIDVGSDTLKICLKCRKKFFNWD